MTYILPIILGTGGILFYIRSQFPSFYLSYLWQSTKNISTNITMMLWGKVFNISRLSNTSYVISYYYNNHLYKYPLIIKRGPKTSYKIYHQTTDTRAEHSSTAFGLDITENILPFFGPNHDLYGLEITPQMLGFSSLRIEKLPQKISQTFRANEKIILNFRNELPDY